MLVLFQLLLISSEPNNSQYYYSPFKPLSEENIIGNHFYQGHCIVGDILIGIQKALTLAESLDFSDLSMFRDSLETFLI